MDIRSMLQVSAIVLLVTAAVGVAMAIVRFVRSRNPPAWLSMLHGLLAAAGLTLVGYAAFGAGISALATTGLVLLVLAAAVGAFLNLAFQWKQRLLPPMLVAVHATLAVIGFGCLLLAAF
jgi:hypothetical protein